MTTIDEVSRPAELEVWQQAAECLASRKPQSATSYRLMAIDDTPVTLRVLRAYLEQEGYEQIETIEDSREALAELLRYDPDLLLLDLMMPHVSGIDILETIREIPSLRSLPVIVITAAEDRGMKRKCLELGVMDFLSKPIDAEDLILRVRNTLTLRSYQNSLEEKVFARTAELAASREEVVHCLARAAECRDDDTGHHVIRVGRYAALIASALGMDLQTIQTLELASTLHDVGKIGIADAILRKPGPLTDEERAVMKEHSNIGKRICLPEHRADEDSRSGHTVAGAMMLNAPRSPLLQMAARIALTHHERWDGRGYPHGLRGEQIPLEGRITAVADVFDALSSKRPYKPAFSIDKCFSILEQEAGKHFDPQIVKLFLERKRDVMEVHGAYQCFASPRTGVFLC